MKKQENLTEFQKSVLKNLPDDNYTAVQNFVTEFTTLSQALMQPKGATVLFPWQKPSLTKSKSADQMTRQQCYNLFQELIQLPSIQHNYRQSFLQVEDTLFSKSIPNSNQEISCEKIGQEEEQTFWKIKQFSKKQQEKKKYQQYFEKGKEKVNTKQCFWGGDCC